MGFKGLVVLNIFILKYMLDLICFKMLPRRFLDNALWRERGAGRRLLATSVIFGRSGCIGRSDVGLAG